MKEPLTSGSKRLFIDKESFLYFDEGWFETDDKNVASNLEQVLEATPHKAPTIRSPASHHENYTS